MRALRSRSVKDDSGSNKSDTAKAIKKEKRNKKFKKNSKRKAKASINISTTSTEESDILTKSSELTEYKKTRKNEESSETKPLTKSSESTEHKKTPKNEESSKTKPLAKSKSVTRHSTIITTTEDAPKENNSPSIKEASKKRNVSEADVLKKSPEKSKNKKKTRRNKRSTSEESLEFKNVVTSTAMKPKKTKNIRDSSDENEPRSKTRLSRKLSSVNRTQNFDVTEIKNESKTTSNKKRSSLSSTFEKTHISQEYSPTFKNIVTSTTIKPKKRKRSNKNGTKSTNTSRESMEIDVKDNTPSNVLPQNDVINISDSIAANTNKNQTNVTDVLNSTYLKIDDESPSILTTNNSGQWNIEEQKSIIDISDDTKMFESNSNPDVFTSPVDTNKDTKKVLFRDTSLTKSARKKWQRFPRNSQGANSVLEQISTPQKKSLPNKSLNISQKLNKTGNTSVRTSQSANKIKRTAMPNFALIHQKAYEKMESISEYSQRKKNRANLLLSNKKDQTNGNEAGENKIKSSRQLFTNEKKDRNLLLSNKRDQTKENEASENKIKSSRHLFTEKPIASKINVNRFGFKLKTNTTTYKPQEKPEKSIKPLKPSIYDREEVVAIANKKVLNTGKLRENKRELLKGVRTNRRFDLLMKMRNN